MPGMRDALSQLMSPRDGPQLGSDEYQQMLLDNMKRYHGDRDQAVRNTNIAGGYGNSTAQRFMHEAGPVPGGAPLDPMTTGAVPVPTPRPDVAPAPTAAVDPGIGSGIPMPEQGIGSGIPMPQLPSEPPVDLPASVTLPDRHGGVTMGEPPALPYQGVPTPTPRPAQYTIKKDKKKKKKLS